MQMAASYTKITAIPAQNPTNTKNLPPSPTALQAHGHRSSCRTIEKIHAEYASVIQYNNENSLSSVLSIATDIVSLELSKESDA